MSVRKPLMGAVRWAWIKTAPWTTTCFSTIGEAVAIAGAANDPSVGSCFLGRPPTSTFQRSPTMIGSYFLPLGAPDIRLSMIIPRTCSRSLRSERLLQRARPLSCCSSSNRIRPGKHRRAIPGRRASLRIPGFPASGREGRPLPPSNWGRPPRLPIRPGGLPAAGSR